MRAPGPVARAAWLSIIFPVAAAGLWALAYASLLGDPLGSIVIFGAGPLAFAGLAVGIVYAVRRSRPRWVPFVGILLSLVAMAYIGIQFLYILAVLSFA